MNKLFFVDFEASSLMGYPIQIGWAELDLDKMSVFSDSILIRPVDFWADQEDLWSDNAEAMHGLSMDKLKSEGVDVVEVCRRVDSTFDDAIAYSDNASYDGRWADMMYQESGYKKAWRCEDVRSLFKDVDTVILRNSFIRAKERAPEYHRADQDAARLAWAWFYVLHGGG